MGKQYWVIRFFTDKEIKKKALMWLAVVFGSGIFTAPTANSQAVTQRYGIEVAGIRIGTMTASRNAGSSAVLYEQISDVELWFFGKIKIYYKTNNQCDLQRKLLRSDVAATTTKGNFRSSTIWQTDHYVINANQYKYSLNTKESQPITFTISQLYFEEPVGQNRIYAEYFGKYATVTPTTKGSYRVKVEDREDEYFYENGKLVRVVKKNPLKNFVIRLEK